MDEIETLHEDNPQELPTQDLDEELKERVEEEEILG